MTPLNLRIRARRRETDRGVATLETVIVMPALLLMVVVAVQAVWWYMARNAAHAAAQEGVRAARIRTAPPCAGPQAALRFVAEVTRGELRDPTADLTGSTPTTAAVTVSGGVPSFIPGLHLSVSQVARAPREVFTHDPRGFGNSEGLSDGKPGR